MRTGDYLEALGRFPAGTVADLTGGAPFLVLSPHPDDETLGCGGLLALSEAEGVPGHVVILTDGAASHPGSSRYPADRLAELRRDEAQRALATLGLPADRLTHLDLPDSRTPGAGPAFEAAVEAIATRARAVEARTLFVTWGRDPHCDHETASAMARAAAARLHLRLWDYPIWGLHLPPDDPLEEPPPRGLVLDIGPVRRAKRRAIDCYASQMTALIDDDPSGFRFTEAQLAPFLRPVETFIAVRP